MPNYLYRSKAAKDGALLWDGVCPCCREDVCPCWKEGVSVYQHFNDKPLETCPECGSRVYRAIVGVKFRFRHGMKGTMHDYRDDLARFAGDPEAYVDGPRALQKLIDKRKREGWEIKKGFDDPTNPTVRSSESVVREAFERAAAKGFTPDDD